jgi:phosphohistidine phosphatase
MEVYLVRHAIAFDRDAARWPNDSKRPLTPDGEERFRRAARGLKRLVPSVDIMLASPFVRAWRTGEILAEEAGWPAPTPSDPLGADRPVGEAIDLLRAHRAASSAAVVGHEPNLSEMASELLAGDPDLVAIEMKKGGVAALSLNGSPGREPAVLRWVLTPKALRLLSS